MVLFPKPNIAGEVIPSHPAVTPTLSEEQLGGGTEEEQQVQQDPMTTFNLAILQMLKAAQSSAGDINMFRQQVGLESEALRRIEEPTPESERILGPAQQTALRAGRVGAVQAQLDEVGAQIKAKDARLRNFESILGQIREIGGDIADRIKVPVDDDVIEGYRNLIQAGGNVASIPDEVRNQVLSKLTDEDFQKGLAASRALKAPFDTRTSDIKNFQYAQGQGYEGGFLDFLSEGKEIKPPSAAQFTAAGYANRVVQTNDIFDNLADEISGMSSSTMLFQRNIPTWMPGKTETMKLLEQAERNFINALLRRESGAAIADTEFESASKQYFPQAGDTPAVLKQKKDNRDLIEHNLIRESGAAFQEEIPLETPSVVPDGTIVERNGVRYIKVEGGYNQLE